MLTSHAPVLNPSSLDEALAFRAAHPDARPIAGGTDLMVQIESGSFNPPQILNLWGVDALRGIEESKDGVRIGALATWTDIIQHAATQAHAPALVEASHTIGARQIQNRGTLAGNVANASPAGDSLPVLLALDAEVEATSQTGTRRIAMADLYTGYRTLSLKADELITAIHLPLRHSGDRQHFRKVGTRMAQSISKVMLGARVRIEDGVVSQARIAFGSVAATPIRIPNVEAALVGKPVDPAAADLLQIKPIDDIRSTAAYRNSVARRILRRILLHWAQA
jgi:CO/xanthine dehydrogenase FAD-binding subunit